MKIYQKDVVLLWVQIRSYIIDQNKVFNLTYYKLGKSLFNDKSINVANKTIEKKE